METPAATIIIPVYNAAEKLEKCLDSVFAHTALDDNLRLLLIDDAGGETRLEDIYASISSPFVGIIRHKKNLGYTGSVNQGLTRAASRDVLLLNSDAIVTPGWFTKLQCHALSTPSVGTVTPVSNNAGEFSVPSPNENTMPAGLSIDNMAAIVNECGNGLHFPAPTGNGFCMYIRRPLINAIGLFDEINFPRGFGEENDFCMRGYYAGFENLIALDAYVWHAGHASFGQDFEPLTSKAQNILQGLYPDYFNLVTIFRQNIVFKQVRECIRARLAAIAPIQAEIPPLQPQPANTLQNLKRAWLVSVNYARQYGTARAARKIAKNIWKALTGQKGFSSSAKVEAMFAELQAAEIQEKDLDNLRDKTTAAKILSFLGSANDVVCIIDHNWGGGANLYAREYIRNLTKTGKSALYLAHAVKRNFIYAIFHHGTSCMVFCIKSLADALDADWLNIREIFVNELVQWDGPDNGRNSIAAIANVTKAITACAKKRRIPLRMPVHDYFSLCPSYNLISRNGIFCALPPESQCRQCLKSQFDRKREKMDIREWRKIFAGFIDAVDEIICFSRPSAEIVSRVYPQAPPKIKIMPHKPLVSWKTPYQPPATGAMTIAVIGSISPGKGLEIVKQLHPLLKKDEKLVIIGSCDEFAHNGNVIFHGPYQRERLPDILRFHGVTVGLIPSVWPETFCYVAQECMGFGLPFATFDLGAQGEKARQYANGLTAPQMTAASAYETLCKLDARRLAATNRD